MPFRSPDLWLQHICCPKAADLHTHEYIFDNVNKLPPVDPSGISETIGDIYSERLRLESIQHWSERDLWADILLFSALKFPFSISRLESKTSSQPLQFSELEKWTGRR